MIFTTIRYRYRSFNCKTIANNFIRKAFSRIITQIRAMTTVSSSNKAAETGSKKADDMKFTEISGF